MTVQNQYGNLMHVSKDILEKMSSATHFEKEVPMNMTSLAEILSTVSDTIFTVQFRKQVNKDSAEKVLKETSVADLKDKAKLASIVKQFTEGESCTMICHLVEAENNLGRSVVIDLTAHGDNKFRQIDHRTIESITFQNVKYFLKKGGKKADKDSEEEEKKGAPKWDTKKLAVGNWFSGTSYFQTKNIAGNEITTQSNGREIVVSRDILEYEMYNASIFAKEEKLPLTKVVKILKEAHSTAFTVNFNCKVDEKVVQEKLAAATAQDLKDSKNFAKELLLGREATVTGRLVKTEGKLGRSLVVGLDKAFSFS